MNEWAYVIVTYIKHRNAGYVVPVCVAFSHFSISFSQSSGIHSLSTLDTLDIPLGCKQAHNFDGFLEKIVIWCFCLILTDTNVASEQK